MKNDRMGGHGRSTFFKNDSSMSGNANEAHCPDGKVVYRIYGLLAVDWHRLGLNQISTDSSDDCCDIMCENELYTRLRLKFENIVATFSTNSSPVSIGTADRSVATSWEGRKEGRRIDGLR